MSKIFFLEAGPFRHFRFEGGHPRLYAVAVYFQDLWRLFGQHRLNGNHRPKLKNPVTFTHHRTICLATATSGLAAIALVFGRLVGVYRDAVYTQRTLF